MTCRPSGWQTSWAWMYCALNRAHQWWESSTFIVTMNVWVLPLPFYSHALCCAQFGGQIARHKLRVTLFLTEYIHRRLQTTVCHMFQDWRSQGLDIHVRSLGEDDGMCSKFQTALSSFEKIFRMEAHGGCKPTCLIMDVCYPSVKDLAIELGVPALVFVPFSSSYISAILYHYRLELNGILKLPHSASDARAGELISLPGLLSPIKIRQLSEVMFRESPFHGMNWGRAQVVESADYIIMSSFRDLEPRSHEVLKRLLATSSGKIPQLWTIGPTFPLDSCSPFSELGYCGHSEMIQFLDSQPKSSVVYVSFGTDVKLSDLQLEELVFGLESTDQAFLIVSAAERTASQINAHGQDAAPSVAREYLSQSRNKSLIVSWAPQQLILSHPATGAFMSHCGQNSLMEAVSMGVPILAWPFQYDQFITCRFLVDEIQTALEIRPGLGPGEFVDREDIQKSVNALFHSEGGRELRNRALKMKLKAHESVSANGSSTKNILSIVALIKDFEERYPDKPTQ